jgi:hypothetical protein
VTGGGGDADIPKMSDTDKAIIETYGNSPGFKGLNNGAQSSSVASKEMQLLKRIEICKLLSTF